MKFTITFFLPIVFLAQTYSQNVGIGTTTPSALLHVNTGVSDTNGVLITGSFRSGSSVPSLGAGSRMMFYPGKAAFRAGLVEGQSWNNNNVGNYSSALGANTTASGEISTALGFNTTASGHYSTALGYSTTASGLTSTTTGIATVASGNYSTAMGTFASTNGQDGAFVIGDHSTGNTFLAPFANSFITRFAGGYRLYTNSATTIGTQLIAGGNAWTTLSDVNRKENFAEVDGEDFLQKIAKFNLVSWNYKGQDPKSFRHYGPMAQEFFRAFGNDSYGTVGDDTTINQADFDGVNLIAIQALERRTTEQHKQVQKQEQIILEQQKEIELLKKQVTKLLKQKK